jgi:hypothetical protein
MYNNNYIVIILLVIILIYCVCGYNKDGFKNRFNTNQSNQSNQFNIDELDVIDESKDKYLVYDYLLTDGLLFYLYNSRDLIIERKNPLIFETLDEVEQYRKTTNTSQLNITNLLIKKKSDDPTENYERTCSKKISPFNARMNTCLAYSKTEKDIEKNKDLFNDLNLGDHHLESCIIDAIGEDNPDLKIESNNQTEIKFMDQFF